MKKRLLFSVLILLFRTVYSQTYTVSGIITSSGNGEQLPYVYTWEEVSKKSCVSNNYGFYSLTLPEGEISLKFSYIGHKQANINFYLSNDTVLNVGLNSINNLKEVLVEAERSGINLVSSQMSLNSLQIKAIKKLPVLLGEKDILKAVQLMPGIQSGMEGGSGIFVRGGGKGQNLFLIDGVPLYSVQHLFGFFSVFNEDAISYVNVYKGCYPARYSGRLSSVIDVTTKEGNNKKQETRLTVGTIATKFNIEGPIVKDKASYFISARRSYFDILARPFIKKYADGSIVSYYFYDFNTKINYKFSDKSRIYMSTYYGKDVYFSKFENIQQTLSEKTESKFEDGLNWGNLLNTLRWNYIWSNKLFSNISVNYTRFKYLNKESYYSKSDSSTEQYNYSFDSGINDFSTRLNIDYFFNPEHNIKFGGNIIFHTFIPGLQSSQIKETSNNGYKRDTSYNYQTIRGNENNIYFEDNWKINAFIKFNLGINYSIFNVEETNYTNWEPRLSSRFKLSGKLAFKIGYAKMAQYLHLLSHSVVSLPTDLWVPVTTKIKPQTSNQIDAGIYYAINSSFKISIETYIKELKNIIAYSEGQSIFSGHENWQDKIEFGTGEAYGIEFMIEKSKGKTEGFITYTYSKSTRQFNSISFWEKYPFKYDRRHDLSFVITQKFNKKIDAGLTWVFGTGYPFTTTSSKYISAMMLNNFNNFLEEGILQQFYEIEYFRSRNNFRMPTYHRLDLSINFHKKRKSSERTFSISLFNLYSRLNAFYITESFGKLYKYSIFPIIPSVSYSIHFK